LNSTAQLLARHRRAVAQGATWPREFAAAQAVVGVPRGPYTEISQQLVT